MSFWYGPIPRESFSPTTINSYYFGWAGDGHINRFNISHALYYVFGEDELNPLEAQEVDIDAWMAAVELSYDRDWVRFRTSYFFASGDDDITDGRGEGFDTILRQPEFRRRRVQLLAAATDRAIRRAACAAEQPGAGSAVEQDPGSDRTS